MEGGRVSSLNVELEQADDKESFEALHGDGIFEVSVVFLSQRNGCT